MNFDFVKDIVVGYTTAKVAKEITRKAKKMTDDVVEWEAMDVPVKPWWESKINWTQIIGFGASLLTLFGYTVPAEYIPHAVVVITGVQSVLTWVFRTFFTNSLVWGSIGEIFDD